MAGAIQSVTVGGNEILGAPIYSTGDSLRFAENLAGTIVRGAGAFDLENASTSFKLLDTSDLFSGGGSVVFQPDGRRVFLLGGTVDARAIYQYDLTIPWDITSVVSDTEKSFIQSEATARGIADFKFKSDGSKLYVLEGSGGALDSYKVYQYSLSNTWNISDSSYDNKFFDFANIDSTSQDANHFQFRNDGQKVFVLSPLNERLYQFSLTAPWEIDSVRWDSQFLNVDIYSGTVKPQSFHFVPDGKSFWLASNSSSVFCRYALSMPWEVGSGTSDVCVDMEAKTGVSFNSTLPGSGNLGTLVYDDKTIGLDSDTGAPQLTPIQGIAFNSAGTRLFGASVPLSTINQFDLSSAWDITTAVWNSVQYDYSSVGGGSPSDVAFNDDGTRMFVIDYTSTADAIYQFTLDTAYDLADVSYDSVSLSMPFDQTVNQPLIMAFSTEGFWLYVLDQDSSRIYQWTLTTPWDLTTASFDDSWLFPESLDLGPTGIAFRADGARLYVSAIVSQSYYEFILTTPWDVTTAVYSELNYDWSGEDTDIRDIELGDGGTRFFGMSPGGNENIYQYTFLSQDSKSGFNLNGCNLYWSQNGGVYQFDLPCGTFIPPSSDNAANEDPIDRSFTPLSNGNCVVIQSTAIGFCSSEEVTVVTVGDVDFTLSSKFLGNDSFCGELEAHLFDSYGVQNSSDPTNLVSGADHLAGSIVGAWGDGQDLGFYKVSSTGTFTIPTQATSVTYGLPYTGWFKSVKLAYGAEAGTALLQRKRVPYLGFVLHCAHARGLYYGPSTDKLNPMPEVEAGKVVSPDAIWPAYDQEQIEFPGEWDTDSRVVLRAQAPRGVTVLAAVVQVDTREKI